MSKRGRPAGSKNVQYADAVEIPAVCPKCKSPELKAIRGNKVSQVNVAGTFQGVAYSRVEWHDKSCVCGQRVRVRVFVPK